MPTLERRLIFSLLASLAIHGSAQPFLAQLTRVQNFEVHDSSVLEFSPIVSLQKPAALQSDVAIEKKISPIVQSSEEIRQPASTVTPVETFGANLVVVKPEYPTRCRQQRIEGTTEIRILFSESGKVKAVSLVKGVEKCPEFAEASLQAAWSARLTGSRLSQSTDAAILPFRFQLDR